MGDLIFSNLTNAIILPSNNIPPVPSSRQFLVLLFTELCATSYEQKLKREAEKQQKEQQEKEQKEQAQKSSNCNGGQEASKDNVNENGAGEGKPEGAKDSTTVVYTSACQESILANSNPEGPGHFPHPRVPNLHPVTANLACPHFYLAQYLLELVITSTEMWILQALPSRLAASCLYLANRIRGIKVPWPERLEKLTNQNEILHVKPLAKEIFGVVTAIHQAQNLAAAQQAAAAEDEAEGEKDAKEKTEGKEDKTEEGKETASGTGKDDNAKEKDSKDDEKKDSKDAKNGEKSKPKGDENSARGVKALFKKYNMRKYFEVAKSVPTH